MKKTAAVLAGLILGTLCSAQTAPEWKDRYFSGDRFGAWSELLLSVLHEHGIDARIHDGGALEMLAVPEGSPFETAFPGEKIFPLDTIAGFCGSVAEDQWREAVESYVTELEQVAQFTVSFSAMEDDWDFVKDFLSIRLYPDSAPGISDGSTWIVREDIPSIYTAVVFDLPLSLRNVPRNLLEKWNRTDDEVFATARENLKTVYPYTLETATVMENVSFGLIYDPQDYLHASHIFELFSEGSFAGAHGTFFSLPAGSIALFYPFDDPAAFNEKFFYFFALTRQLYRSDSGRLSPEIFWKSGDHIETVELSVENDQLRVGIPEGLKDFIRRQDPAE